MTRGDVVRSYFLLKVGARMIDETIKGRKNEALGEKIKKELKLNSNNLKLNFECNEDSHGSRRQTMRDKDSKKRYC